MSAIIQDIWPAIVAMASPAMDIEASALKPRPITPGAAQFQEARVIVTQDRVIVGQDSANGPKLVYSEAIEPNSFHKAQSPSTELSYVTTISGIKISWRKDPSCGCGSRLRTWRPLKDMTSSTKDPTE